MFDGFIGYVEYFSSPETLHNIQKLRMSCSGRQEKLITDVYYSWYIRQEDSVQAMSIVQYFEENAATYIFGDEKIYLSLFGRVLLVKSEVSRLCADLHMAEISAKEASEIFASIGSIAGQGDAAQCLAELYIICGKTNEAYDYFEKSANLYKSANDWQRYEICLARMAFQKQYEGATIADKEWSNKLDKEKIQNNMIAKLYYGFFQGGVCFQFGNFPESIKIWTESLEISQNYGAILLSIQISLSIGSAYANLYDLPTAIEWKEKAYLMAKEKGWSVVIGGALASMAETYVMLKSYDKAKKYFEESMPYVDLIKNTRRYVIANNAYGELFLEIGQPDLAKTYFLKARKVAKSIGQVDVFLSSIIGLSIAVYRLGFYHRATKIVKMSVELSKKSRHAYHLIRSLKALAEIQRSMYENDRRESISTLESAIEFGESLEKFTFSSDILTELARDYEAIGDYQKALHYERRARDSWQRNFDQQNGARILAMQVRFDTARAKAEAEHHRDLAKAEAQRAATLDEANQILERLGQVGQEITAKLDYEGVFQTIYGHIKELMPTDFLSIGLVDEDRQVIDIRYRVEDGVRLSPREVTLEADSLVAHCVRENRELLSRTEDGRPPILVPGTRPMNTVLLRPLGVGGRRLGVISVQSAQSDAYGERERRIFSTLCAYSAIALSNAETYDQLERAVGDLREALHRLVQQEKMAALGQLVAGVAHEVNTPLGVTLSAVSLLHDNIRGLQETLGNGGLTRSTLAEHLQTGLELSSLAQRNVVRASDMIRSFKEVAVDRGSDDRRVFDLGDYLREITNLMKAKLTGKGSHVDLDVGLIQMETYPGALAQTITNLLANVADHAYGPDDAGPVRLSARQIEGDVVEIIVSDEGRGLDRETLEHAFDPFFTTNRAAGHMGLGLHVAYNQVTQRLAGRIVLRNREGGGAEAIIYIPRELSTINQTGLLNAAIQVAPPKVTE
jgi:signal transduction histidine kinase/tetratricopeptide (TPR) repeat protein